MSVTTWNVSDEAKRTFDPNLIDPLNYAGNQAVEMRFKDKILGRFNDIRSNRNQKEFLWQRFHKVWAGKHNIKIYEGQSDLYVSVIFKAIESFVSQVKTQVFPTNQFFLIDGNPTVDPAEIEQITELLEHDIEQARIRHKIDLFLRTGFIYGHSIVKNIWKNIKSTNYRRRKTIRPGQPVIIEGEPPPPTLIEKNEVFKYEGPTFDLVDPFRFYVFPITAFDIDDARIVFEDLDVDWAHLKEMEKEGVYRKIDRLKMRVAQDEAARSNQEDSNRQERMNEASLPDNFLGMKVKNRWKLTEVWCRFDLYGDGREIDCKAAVVGDEILEIRQNPLFSQRPPYRVWRVLDEWDNFYGRGLIQGVEHIQYMINAFTNLMLDNQIHQLQPMTVINENIVDMPAGEIEQAPGYILAASGPPNEAMAQFRPPSTLNDNLQVIQFLTTTGQDVFGAPPILQGTAGPRGQTATEADILASGAAAFTNSMASKIENDVLSKILSDFHILEQQFRDQQSHQRVVGTPKVNIDILSLTNDVRLKWFTASDALQRKALEQVKQQEQQAANQQVAQLGQTPGGEVPAGGVIEGGSGGVGGEGFNQF